MPSLSRPRRGSLQFWPRKRAAKFVPSVNWKPVRKTGDLGVLGFITYKVGMGTAIVKDNTEHSMTNGSRITVPVTILEAPSMKIYSVRFYENGQVKKDVIVSNEKDLKRKVKVPKTLNDLDKEIPEEYDDIRVLVYSMARQTGIKKKPDMLELAISGDSKETKLEFVKSSVGKEISIEDFAKTDLVDVRGVTKGKGTQGPVKRFGIALRVRKAEKGQRKVGSIGPWHPARVVFRTPMAGQTGLFTRTHYNLKVIDSAKISEKDINPGTGFRHYGKIKSSYIVVAGSVQGPKKRQIILTQPLRPNKKQTKKSYEFIDLEVEK